MGVCGNANHNTCLLLKFDYIKNVMTKKARIKLNNVLIVLDSKQNLIPIEKFVGKNGLDG